MTQQSLFDLGSPVKFDGATYDAALDKARLNRQLRLVLDVMKDGQWRTLYTISLLTGQPEASVSARLRDLRKERFGAWTVDRQRVSMEYKEGLWEYRVTK